MRWIFVFSLTLLAVAAAPARAEQPLDGLLDRVRIAYGGDALPAKGDTILLTGRTHSNAKGADGRMERELIWPSFLRFEISYDDGAAETRLLKDGAGWRDGEPTNQALTLAMRLQAARLALPMLLDWAADKLSDLGEHMREDGGSVRRLRVDLGDDLFLFVEIGVEEARILRTAGVMRMGGAEMEFGAIYSDFRGFGEVSWPSREEQYAMGRPTGWTIIESVTFGDTQQSAP